MKILDCIDGVLGNMYPWMDLLLAVTVLFPPQHILPRRSHGEALFTRTREEERSPYDDQLFIQSSKPERDDALFFAWISCLTYRIVTLQTKFIVR